MFFDVFFAREELLRFLPSSGLKSKLNTAHTSGYVVRARAQAKEKDDYVPYNIFMLYSSYDLKNGVGAKNKIIPVITFHIKNMKMSSLTTSL